MGNSKTHSSSKKNAMEIKVLLERISQKLDVDKEALLQLLKPISQSTSIDIELLLKQLEDMDFPDVLATWLELLAPGSKVNGVLNELEERLLENSSNGVEVPFVTTWHGYDIIVKVDRQRNRATVSIEPSKRPGESRPFYQDAGGPVEECSSLLKDFFRALDRVKLPVPGAEWITGITVRPSVQDSLGIALILDQGIISSMLVREPVVDDPLATQEEKQKAIEEEAKLAIMIARSLKGFGVPFSSSARLILRAPNPERDDLFHILPLGKYVGATRGQEINKG